MSVPRPQTFVLNEIAPLTPAIISGFIFSSFPSKMLMFFNPFNESILKTADISLKSWKMNEIKSGHCAFLDGIDEVTSTVTERINPLLKMKSEVPENPNEPEISINPNFRLIRTCKIYKINKIDLKLLYKKTN